MGRRSQHSESNVSGKGKVEAEVDAQAPIQKTSKAMQIPPVMFDE